MSKEPKEYLRHIHDECLYIISVSENLLFEDFMEDETLKRAVVRSLEIIGEATNRLLHKTDTIHLSYARQIVSTRNRIIHGYDHVSDEIIWGIVIQYLPVLQSEIIELLNE